MNLNCTCQIWCYPRYRVKLTVCKGRETSVEVWKCGSWTLPGDFHKKMDIFDFLLNNLVFSLK
jgi:hypothetical protein